ncbi:hypothetical protein D3C78_1552970 [compost metagenome]
MAEVEAEGLIQLVRDVQLGQVCQHLPVDLRNLLAASFTGADDSGDRLLAIVVVIQILVEHQVIGEFDQLG